MTVWCGTTVDRVIGPVFLRDTMNGERYHDMLEDIVIPELEGLNNNELIFMQNGAPAHYANTVLDLLNDKFSQRWIWRRGPYSWPAHSPDLTPCDFFVWG